MISIQLVKALVGIWAYLEQSDEAVVDPDVAGDLIESSMGYLLELDDEDRMEFTRLMRAVASEEIHPANRSTIEELARQLEEQEGDNDENVDGNQVDDTR